MLGLGLGPLVYRAGCPYLRIMSRVSASARARVVLVLGLVLGLRLGPL